MTHELVLEAKTWILGVYISTHANEFSSESNSQGHCNYSTENININYERGNIYNNILLLPLGHISNSLPLALESIILLVLEHFTPMAYRCNTCYICGIDFTYGSDLFKSVCILHIFAVFHAIIKFTNFIGLALYMFWIIGWNLVL